jgi:hypothetical protein
VQKFRYTSRDSCTLQARSPAELLHLNIIDFHVVALCMLAQLKLSLTDTAAEKLYCFMSEHSTQIICQIITTNKKFIVLSYYKINVAILCVYTLNMNLVARIDFSIYTK